MSHRQVRRITNSQAAPNYREVLLTLPAKATITTKRVRSPDGWGDTDGGNVGSNNLRRPRSDYRSRTGPTPNVLAHIRLERPQTDWRAARVLFVEG